MAVAAFLPVQAVAARSGQLTARPSSQAALSLPTGESMVFDFAVAYRPPNLPAGPRPLMVLFHGAGSDALTFARIFEPLADRRGMLLLSVQSRGTTWDIIRAGSADPIFASRIPSAIWFGPDANRVGRALDWLFAKAPVDQRGLIAAGFSDGGTYALALGLRNPRMFPSIIALSPGILMMQGLPDRAQKLFIAHGRSDKVIAFSSDEEEIVGVLRNAGAQLRFRPFDGKHEIQLSVVEEGLAYALGN